MAHPIRARTYMTLGIVTLGGFKQRDQAVKYFRKALQIQPEVRLSPGLANPDIQAAFDEAVAGLASGTSDEMTPEKALVHEPIRSAAARAGPVPVDGDPDKELGADARSCCGTAPGTCRVIHRPADAKDAAGAFEATIPASATAGAQVVYFIEARRTDGSVAHQARDGRRSDRRGIDPGGTIDTPAPEPVAPAPPAATPARSTSRSSGAAGSGGRAAAARRR